jgi:hypothetical protein
VPTWKQEVCSGEGRCPVVPLVFKNGDRLFQLINQDGELAITLRFFDFSVFSLLATFFMSCTKPVFFRRIDKRMSDRKAGEVRCASIDFIYVVLRSVNTA